MPSPVQNVSGESLVLQIGNGATPEVFNVSCTINTTRALNFSANASTAEIPDCVTPSNPAQVLRQIKSLDLSFDGAGVLDGPSILPLILWEQSGLPKNCLIIQNKVGSLGGFTVKVPLVITSVQATGARGEQQAFSAKFEQASAPTSIAANPG